MHSRDTQEITTMKAARSTYVALSAIYFILAAAYIAISFTKGWMPSDADTDLPVLHALLSSARHCDLLSY